MLDVPFTRGSPTPDDVRVRGVATESETLFMGIAPADVAAGYLDGVVHDEITIEWDCFGFATEIKDEDWWTPGTRAPPILPLRGPRISGSRRPVAAVNRPSTGRSRVGSGLW
jgi:hypothetical protein